MISVIKFRQKYVQTVLRNHNQYLQTVAEYLSRRSLYGLKYDEDSCIEI